MWRGAFCNYANLMSVWIKYSSPGETGIFGEGGASPFIALERCPLNLFKLTVHLYQCTLYSLLYIVHYNSTVD